ncbi:COG1361 S-layer family protein [Bifidobacterium olomucense]|uniref:ABC transporter permease n=1 Tax=Bifidobacterium olomucense TaxID=2675324 RepID=A0A7Y0HVY2_9BIFI|nr:ABC transporter permease [Bifidobacterium sp. DSM 109959]NMM98745.1 ABC transporter permease [Bifidobacterium sp. DSM 109959]
MKHLTNRTLAVIVALLATIALAMTVISLPTPQAYAVDGSDGTAQTDGEDATPTAGPVPNIIISNFTYGGDSVAAGANFNLDFTFQNMGQVAVTNMVITVDGGESFAIAGGTNTFYVDALWAGYAMTQTVPMQALSSAKSGAQPVTVSFKYEYVDANVRSSSQSDIKISVPISQPDRFEVNDPVMPEQSFAGEETTITLDYVNKGKGDISNVEATMEGEGFDATMKTQYVGNVASGTTGSIGYAFTPQASGELDAKLKVTYEDSDGQSKTKEFPVKLTVSDPMPVDDGTAVDPNMEMDANQGLPWWVWAVVAVIAIAVIAVLTLLVRRKRKKKAQSDIDEEWDDWSAVNSSSEAGKDDGSTASGSANTEVIEPAAHKS